MNGINTSYRGTQSGQSVKDDKKPVDNQEVKQEERTNQNTVYGGSLNLLNDAAGEKQAKAEKDALKTLLDTFSNEHVDDVEIASRKEHIAALDADIKENQETVRGLETVRADLATEYKVDPDSQEAKELELLQKEVDAGQPNPKARLSMEEKEQLAQLHERGLTEYQGRSIELYKQQSFFGGQIDEAKSAQAEDTGVIHGIHKARLKQHDMVDSQKEAQQILADASDEIVTTVVGEAVDEIDDKREENEQKAEDKKDEQNQSSSNADNITNDNLQNVQSDILKKQADQSIANHKLTREDVLGIAVDEQV